MNIWDIIILIIIAVILVFAFKQATSKAKKGGCSCGCDNCSNNCAERYSNIDNPRCSRSASNSDLKNSLDDSDNENSSIKNN